MLKKIKTYEAPALQIVTSIKYNERKKKKKKENSISLKTCERVEKEKLQTYLLTQSHNFKTPCKYCV